MLGRIPISNINICTDWIEEQDSKRLAGTLLHEATHRYLRFPAKGEWYYLDSGGWVSPDGSYKRGVTHPANVIYKTPDAYRCLFRKVW